MRHQPNTAPTVRQVLEWSGCVGGLLVLLVVASCRCYSGVRVIARYSRSRVLKELGRKNLSIRPVADK